MSPTCDHEHVPGISSVHHLTGHQQRWPEVDADIGAWVERTHAEIATALGEELVGVYLHGSLAMGCYYRPKSDLDLLIVSKDALSSAVREKVARGLLAASDSRPTTGDIEATAMRMADTREFVHPSPYEVHFSSDRAHAIRDSRADDEAANTDPDLAAHCTATRSRGITLLGEGIEHVFSPVPVEAYLDSIRGDLDWILDDDNILDSPYYGVLNACRVLMVLAHGPHLVPSKEEAATWALESAPTEHIGLIRQCLECYRSSAPVSEQERPTDGHGWDSGQLLAFRDWARGRS